MNVKEGTIISTLHHNHRKRVKDEFDLYGLDHFPPHKVIEMFLFFSIPRVDTNEIAHLLLNRFGSLSGVINAPADLLMETKGVGPETVRHITFIKALFKRHMQDYYSNYSCLDTLEQGKEYVKYRFLGLTSEQVHIACLGANGRILYSDVLIEGAPEHVGIPPIAVTKIAIRTDAVSILLSHNHPYGICMPSKADLLATNVLREELMRMEIRLFDHIIVGSDGVLSMAEGGFIPESE